MERGNGQLEFQKHQKLCQELWLGTDIYLISMVEYILYIDRIYLSIISLHPFKHTAFPNTRGSIYLYKIYLFIYLLMELITNTHNFTTLGQFFIQKKRPEERRERQYNTKTSFTTMASLKGC